MQAAAAHLGDGPVLVLNGDVPLVTAEALAELIEAHAASRRRRRPWPRWSSTTRRATGASCAATTGRSSAWWRRRSPATRPPSELAIREVNAGVYAFDGAALKDALERLTPDNAQGELYLPSTLELLDRVAAHPLDDPTLLLGVNDRADLARVRALAQARIHREHMRAGVTIVDPASTLIDVDGRDRRRHRDRAVVVPARRDHDRGALRGRAR